MNSNEYLYREEFEQFLLNETEFFSDNDFAYEYHPLLWEKDSTATFNPIFDFVEDYIDDYSELYIQINWSLGGTIGSWWDDKIYDIGGETEPYFTQFYDIIKLIDPHASPKNFLDCVEIYNKNEYDWYGGCITRRFKYVNLYKLFVKVKGYK